MPSKKFAVYPSLKNYDLGTQVGEGTYGQVFKAFNKLTNHPVALKKLYLKEDVKGNEKNRDGFPITGIREIEILRSLSHVNIVQLEAMVSFSENMDSINMYMIFEYMDHDLTGILNHSVVDYSIADIKCLVKQMFDGLEYLHDSKIIHRDIKGANLLLNNKGYLKIADFGLARRIHIDRDSGEPLEGFEYTNRVVTLWYRAPELLLGTSYYSYEVDIWSAGCIIVEFFTKAAIFQGKTEIDQLELIFKSCGTPDDTTWPEMKQLPWTGLFKFQSYPRVLERDLSLTEMEFSQGLLDLVSSILTCNPAMRPTAKQVLGHPFFTSERPLPSLPEELPKIEGDWHEYEGKLRRKEKKLGAVKQAPPPPSETVSSQSKFALKRSSTEEGLLDAEMGSRDSRSRDSQSPVERLDGKRRAEERRKSGLSERVDFTSSSQDKDFKSRGRNDERRISGYDHVDSRGRNDERRISMSKSGISDITTDNFSGRRERREESPVRKRSRSPRPSARGRSASRSPESKRYKPSNNQTTVWEAGFYHLFSKRGE